MRPVSQLPVKMIDTTINNELIAIYPTIEKCAEDNRINVTTIRKALRNNSVTRTGYRFERVQ